MTSTQFGFGTEYITSEGKKITARPVTREMFSNAQSATSTSNKKRVAAYARVSTDHEEQQTSYAAQVDYYTHFIKNNPEWEFCGLYADEGISAVTTAKREGFKRMISDALDGKFDRILTKSVSRFARNTVDSLMTIRKLKEKGVGVTFEKENIDTLDSKGELMLTIMSSLAQEESRSISLNTTWGQRKRFADGKVTMPFSKFLGYDRGEDGKPVVNEEEAKIVRLIYKLYLDGKSTSGIARTLTQQGIPTPSGNKCWQCTTIDSILQNEKYRGDAHLQKTFCVDFLTKKMKRNEGEVQSYYVTNSHPAIVTGEVFDLVQCEHRRRQESGTRICSGHIFASRIYCGECGGLYGSKVWGSNTKYRRMVWQCNNKYRAKTRCSTPHLSDEQIQTAFTAMVNGMLESKEHILAFYDELIEQLTDVTPLEQEKERLERDGSVIEGEMKAWIAENARRAMSQLEYCKRYDELETRLNEVNAKLSKVDETILLRNAKRGNAQQVMAMLRQAGLASEFDEGLFGAIVEKVTVYKDKLVFRLKDGTEREATAR